MIVVADTTPLLYLSRIAQLDALHALYQQVLVPVTVWCEAVAALRARPESSDCWSRWIAVSDEADRIALEQDLVDALDLGEAAAIALAELRRAQLLLMDERKGRLIARDRGLNIRGTLGVLVEARRSGHIASLRATIDDLLTEGFRVAPALIAEALRQVGE